MIIEHTYNDKKICHQCKYLKLNKDGWTGVCECPNNRVKSRDRNVTDRKCTYKEL